MRKIFLMIVGLVIFSLALNLPTSVMAATLTLDADTMIVLPNDIELWMFNTDTAESVVINDNSTITLTTGADTDIGFRSNSRYTLVNLVSAGSATVTEICAPSYSQIDVVTTGAATLTISVDSTTLCDASPSDTTSPTGSLVPGGGGGGTSTTGTGLNTPVVLTGETKSVNSLGSGVGTNLFMYLDSQLSFKTAVSSGGQADHVAKVTNIDIAGGIVTIVFESDPIAVEVSVGETKQVDLDGDGTNDVEVKLNSLVVNKAELIFTTIAISKGSGDLVKLECVADADINDPCKAVYYLGNNGKRYVFPNVGTYNTWYPDFSTVKIISQDDLVKYSIGGNVTYRPGTKLVKIQTNPKVYALTKNGGLRWVSTAEIAEEIYGISWASMVEDIPDAFFINYNIEADIEAVVDYDKNLIQNTSPNINTDKEL